MVYLFPHITTLITYSNCLIGDFTLVNVNKIIFIINVLCISLCGNRRFFTNSTTPRAESSNCHTQYFTGPVYKI